MKNKADSSLVPDLLEDHVLKSTLVQAAVVPLRQVAVSIAARGWGLHLATQETALTVEPGEREGEKGREGLFSMAQKLKLAL